MEPELRPASPAMSVKECNTALYSNVSNLLKIAYTIPVTSCEYERTASTLRHLDNYMKSSLGKSRLSSLAILHVHYDTTVDLSLVVHNPIRGYIPEKIHLETFCNRSSLVL